jgi:hypothetical protein
MRAEVLVAAKTRMTGNRVCVGGYVLPGYTSVRLLGSDGHNMPIDTPLEIGDVWELDFEPLDSIVPPHVEDVIVTSGRREREVGNLDGVLRAAAMVWMGPLTGVFDDRLQLSSTNKLGVRVAGPQPTGSTGLWIADAPLIRVNGAGERVRYRVIVNGARITVPYVGVATSVPMITTGTLVRVSLARPFLERCWLQISGWYAIH